MNSVPGMWPSWQRPFLPLRQFKLPALAQEFDRVLVNNLVDVLSAPAAAFHLQRGVRDVERDAHTPVARTVQPEPFTAVVLQHVDGARGRAFRFRITRHAAPEPGVEHKLD